MSDGDLSGLLKLRRVRSGQVGPWADRLSWCRLLVACGLAASSVAMLGSAGTAGAAEAPAPRRVAALGSAGGTAVFTPIQPARLVDTRDGTGAARQRLQASTTLDVQVTGRLGIPDTATAVMINVTAVDAGGRGYLQVLPTGRAALGSASTLNVDVTGQTVPNAAFAPIGDGGRITVYATFATDVVIDVSGFFAPALSSAAGRLVPVTPNRVLDTRIGLGWTPPTVPTNPTTPTIPGPTPTTTPSTTPSTTPATTTPSTTPSTVPPGVPANPGDSKNCGDFATYQQAKAWFDLYFPYYGDVAKLDADHDGIPCESLPGAPKSRAVRVETVGGPATVRLQVAGRGGIPTSGVSAVVVNVTAVDPAGNGYVQVAPTPVTVGASSNLNTAAGRTVANLVVVPLGAGGAVDLYTTVAADLLADVVGYFTDSTAVDSTSGLFVPVAPNRQLDTREPAPQPPLPPGTTTAVDVSDISATAIAFAGNLTATDAARGGWVQIAAPPIPVAASSNLNVAVDGQTIANAVITPAVGGRVEIHNSSTASVLLDVTGYFTNATAPAGTVSAVAVLASLTVTPEYAGPLVYDRALFPHWISDANGCDTRAKVLIRDSLTLAQVDPYGCAVVAGDWYSPYDAATWTSPADVDIDHVVALGEVFDSGAWAWDTTRRTKYANDLTDTRTLRAVTDNVNSSKGDRDPAAWLPPNTADVCPYVADWLAIKARWSLSIDLTEATALNGLLNGACPGLTIQAWSPAP